MQRLPAVTEAEVLKYLYDRTEGATVSELWAAFPDKRFPTNMLFELVAADMLTTDRLSNEVSAADPWNFRYRLSYEQWVRMTYAAALADKLLGSDTV